ncbi:MAG: glycosyltransferase, partial [Phycisphaerae bacterium]|nr:glycosyltransferase [Phycisphaerae bacterium]MDW8262479.1 glycosyltransferase [Phycisphaerales bacterium]
MAKVLLVAFSCCPGMGSEAGIGWNYALRLSRRHELTLLTTHEFRRELEAYLAANPQVRMRIVYRASLLPRKLMVKSYATANLYYYLWQLTIIPTIRRLQRREQYDLVHHVNWGRYWMPAGAAFAGAPFVWGPVGAAEHASVAMLKGMTVRGKIAEITRNFMRRLLEMDPLTRLTVRRADCAIAATRETQARLRAWNPVCLELLSSVGIGPEDLSGLLPESTRDCLPAAAPSPAGDLASGDVAYDFVSIGRLLDWKGFHLGLRAFAQAGRAGMKYAVIGEGP